MIESANNAAWGLQISQDMVRLVRVQRRGDIWSVGEVIEASKLSGLQLPNACGREEPLALCLEDEATLYRMLTLPRTDDPTTTRMVQAQLEALLPGGGAQRFTCTWARVSRNGDATGIWLAAMRRDRLESARQAAAKLGRREALVVPQAAALIAAARIARESPTDQLIIHVGPHQTLLAVIQNNRLAACSCVEGGAVQAASPGTQRAWLADLKDAAQSMTSQATVAPKHALLLGGDGDFLQPLRDALGMTIERSPHAHASLAVGAAASRLTPDVPPLAFRGEEPKPPAASVPTLRLPLRVAAVFLLLVLLGALFLLDLYHESRLREAIAGARPSGSTRDTLQMRLDLGKHLESLGPAPLLILNEISTLAGDGIILEKLQMSQAEGLQLAGTAPNGQVLHTFLAALSKARMLRDVTLESEKVDPQKKATQFEIEAKLVDRYVPPPATASADKKEAGK